MTPISNTIYSLYSLPAFDNLKKPEVVDGSQIKSNKLAVPEDIILFNKLNPKYRRVWNIHSISVANPICSTEFIPIKAKGILQDYLYYCLISHRVTELVNAARKGTSNSQQRIDEDILFNIEIPVPSVEQQRKIAEFLCSIDHKISANNRINDNLSKQCSALYLASVSKASSAKLEELIEQVESGSRPKGGAEQSGVPSIGAEKIEYFGTYDFSDEKYVSEEFFNKMKRGKVHNGDVLLYKDGAYTGKVSLALDGYPHEKCAVNEHVFLLRTKDLSVQFFLYFTLSSPSIMEKVHTLSCAKAAQPGLNQQELLSVEVPLPSKDKVESFELTVRPFMHEIARNALENRRLALIRDTLLPKLLNGELAINGQ